MSSITIMTTQGRAQLAAAVANAQSFPSAKIAVGDGNGATYVPNEAQVGLVHEVWRGNATVARTDDRVIFQAVVPAEAGDFTVREVGVLIGEIGAEQLFIVSQHPSTEKIAAPANGSGPLPITIAFSASAAEQAVLPIGSSDNATLQLSRAPHITVDDLVTEPPAEPADGSLYAIDTGAAGLFVGKGGWLVERVAGAWVYKQPPEKSVIRLAANGAWYQRNGADWAALTFEDPSILWAQILDPPGTFPPSAHNHDDRYFTQAETAALLAGKSNVGHTHPQSEVTNLVTDLAAISAAIAGKVAKAGDTMTGALNGTAITLTGQLQAASGVFSGAVTALAADSAPAFQINKTGGNAVAGFCPVNLGSGRYGLGVYRYAIADGSSGWSAVFDKDGKLGLGGVTAPARTLHVGGDAIVTGLFEIGAGLQALGTLGSSASVLTGGSAAAWRTLAELGVGKKIVAIGTGTGAITFSSAEPDTSYTGWVLTIAPYISGSQSAEVAFGSIGAKTTTGCTMTQGTVAGTSVQTFYILWR